MTSLQESKLSMYQSVQLLCANNPTITAGNAAFTEGLNELNAKISDILNFVSTDIKHTSGITNDKTVIKHNLCTVASEIAGFVFAYANVVKNEVLKQEVNYTYNELRRLREDLIIPTVKIIFNATQANLASLGSYGIDATKLQEFADAMSAYTNALPSTKMTKSEKSSVVISLNNLFKETDELLKNRLDKLLAFFTKAHPEFVNAYKSIRHVDAPTKTTTQIKGNISAAKDGTVIQGANITLTGKTIYSATSDDEGNFNFKPISYGKYQVNVQVTGYQSHTEQNFLVKRGVVNKLVVVLKE